MNDLIDDDLKDLDPELLQNLGHELEAFLKLPLDAVYYRFGVVMHQVFSWGTYDPNVILKADFRHFSRQGLKIAKLELAKLCDKKIHKTEETITITFIVATLTKELNWPDSVIALLSILLLRRFGIKLLEWVCTGNVDDFLDPKKYI